MEIKKDEQRLINNKHDQLIISKIKLSMSGQMSSWCKVHQNQKVETISPDTLSNKKNEL